jgi:SHS2 domain-containing protein
MDEISPRRTKRPPAYTKYGFEELPHTAEGGAAVGQNKEIKAVTYHNLAIERVDDVLTATVVFDV